MNVKRKSILSDISTYSLASVITQIIALLAGIVTRRLLGPTQMGIWSLLQIIVTYSSYTTFGTTEAILREIPYYEAKGDKNKVYELKDLIFSFSLLTAILFSVGVLLYALIFIQSISRPVFYGLLFVSALVLLQRVNNLYVSFLRGFKFFDLAAKQMVYSAIANVVLVAVMTYKFHMYGYMMALVLSFIFNIGYILCQVRFGFTWRIDWKRIWELIRYGFPLMIVGLVDSFFLSIDKIMISKMLGVTELGLYTLALLAFAFLGKVPSTIGIVLVPNLHQKYGERENLEDLRNYILKSVKAFSFVMPILIGLIWFWVPYLSQFVLPDFASSMPPLRALILSAFFLALFHPYSYFITIMRKQSWLFPIILCAGILAVIANFIVLKTGGGMTGVGIVTTVVFALKFSVVYFLSNKYLFTAKQVVNQYLKILIKFLFLLLILNFVMLILPRSSTNLFSLLFASAFFLLAYLPLSYRCLKDLGFIKINSWKSIR